MRNETGGSWNERTDHMEESKTRKKRGEQEDRGKTRRHLEEWAEKKTRETENKKGGRERVSSTESINTGGGEWRFS